MRTALPFMGAVTRSLQVLGLLVVTACGAARSSSEQPPIVGSWKLIAIEGVGRGTGPDDRPYGVITYDNSGHVAFQGAYRVDRKFANGPARATDTEKAAAYDTYGAYFGTYMVDAAHDTITHHVEGSLNPADIGHDLVRFYEFKGNHLIYYVAEDTRGGRFPTKEETVRRIVWERLPAARNDSAPSK